MIPTPTITSVERVSRTQVKVRWTIGDLTGWSSVQGGIFGFTNYGTGAGERSVIGPTGNFLYPADVIAAGEALCDLDPHAKGTVTMYMNVSGYSAPYDGTENNYSISKSPLFTWQVQHV